MEWDWSIFWLMLVVAVAASGIIVVPAVAYWRIQDRRLRRAIVERERRRIYKLYRD